MQWYYASLFSSRRNEEKVGKKTTHRNRPRIMCRERNGANSRTFHACDEQQDPKNEGGKHDLDLFTKLYLFFFENLDRLSVKF